MSGRNAKPVALQLIEGNPNRLTKAEIERREAAQIKIGDREYCAPEFVVRDQNALAKWNELKQIFDQVDTDLVTSSDVGIIARYCIAHSQYLFLLDEKQKKRQSWDKKMKLDAMINRKMDALQKMEDRLFLNPLAKVKNIPKKPKVEDDAVQEKFELL